MINKYAGAVAFFMGAWILLTMLIAGIADLKMAYAEAILAVVPYTGLAVGAVALLVIGAWLQDRK